MKYLILKIYVFVDFENMRATDSNFFIVLKKLLSKKLL